VLAFIDTRSGKFARELSLPGLDDAFNPAFAPDGQSIVVSGNVGGLIDLYRYAIPTGQIERLTSDPYADLAQLAPYAVNVQVKVSLHPAGGSRGPADMRRLAQMMADVGYRGYVVLEYEEQDPPRAACRRYVDEMRTAFNSALGEA